MVSVRSQQDKPLVGLYIEPLDELSTNVSLKILHRDYLLDFYIRLDAIDYVVKETERSFGRI